MFEWLRRKKKQVMNKMVAPIYSPWRPKNRTPKGLMWIWSDEEGWYEVCDFCHGNCGQCGITGTVGNRPWSFQAIIDNSGMASGDHVGIPSPGQRARLGRMIDGS